MAAKPVTIENRGFTFPTQGKAQVYYNEIARELHKTKHILSSGEDFEDLKWIYTSYCNNTEYELKNTEVVASKGGTTVRENNKTHSTTVCFTVTLSDGKEREFSIHKAIKKVADNQEPN